MRRSWVVLGFLSVAAYAQAPLDLVSRFEKTALIREKNGDWEKREVKKARLMGDNVEMEQKSGGIVLIPLNRVVAVLPVLPDKNLTFSSQEVETALNLLKNLSPEIASQAGVDKGELEEWVRFKEVILAREKAKELEKQKEKETEAKSKKSNLKKQIQNWISQASAFRTARTENELNNLKNEGESLARQSPEDMEAILELLAVLSQVQPKEKGETLPDLAKLDDVHPKLVPDDLLGWLAGGVVFLSFFVLLFALAFCSSSLTRFREGAFLGGALYGLVGIALFAFLVWTWHAKPISGTKQTPELGSNMEELVVYLKNRARPVYYFPEKQFFLSIEEFRAGILALLPVSEDGAGLFKAKMKDGSLYLASEKWIWRQPLEALGLPLPFSLTFVGFIPDLESWENPRIAEVFLGSWRVPDVMAEMLKDSATDIWRKGLSSTGLAGVALKKEADGRIMIKVPRAGLRPKYELSKKEEPKKDEEKKFPEWDKILSQEEVSAEEVAKAVLSLKKYCPDSPGVPDASSLEEIAGKVRDKSWILYGHVEDVGGHNFVSAGKMGPDTTDDIYLMGIKDFYRPKNPANPFENTRQHLLVRCIIKTDWVFEMDARQDLYTRKVVQSPFDQRPEKPFEKKPEVKFFTLSGKEVASLRVDPAKETPLISRGKQLRFKKPLRFEINLGDIAKMRKSEPPSSSLAKGGISARQIIFTNPGGDLEFYGITLEPDGDIKDIMEEVGPDYKPRPK